MRRWRWLSAQLLRFALLCTTFLCGLCPHGPVRFGQCSGRCAHETLGRISQTGNDFALTFKQLYSIVPGPLFLNHMFRISLDVLSHLCVVLQCTWWSLYYFLRIHWNCCKIPILTLLFLFSITWYTSPLFFCSFCLMTDTKILISRRSCKKQS